MTAFLHARFRGADLEACVLAGSVPGACACGSPGTHEELISGAALGRGRRPRLVRAARHPGGAPGHRQPASILRTAVSRAASRDV